MTLSRRHFLKTGSAVALSAPFISRAFAAGDTIKLAALYDLSGGLEVNGRPMLETLQYAVKEINDGGGLLGKQVETVIFDTQSNMQLYAEHAQRAALAGDTAVVHGGIISPSREIIRPIFNSNNTLYFYDMPYEGGVCDRNTFIPGVTPGHNIGKLVSHIIKEHGPKGYIVSADYNYGQIASQWINKFAREADGSIVGTEFFPLDASNFGSTISKIQAAKPDWVLSMLVGGPTISFYRQYAASGMLADSPLASTTFTPVEAAVLDPSEIEGMWVCPNYMEALDNPTNKAFLAGFKEMFPDAYPVTDLAMASYQGIHLWAEGVRRAGTADRMPVIEALESGISLEMPSGTVTIDAATHHCVLDVYLGQYRNGEIAMVEAFPAQQPVDTAQVCDLKANPDDTTQYVIEVQP